MNILKSARQKGMLNLFLIIFSILAFAPAYVFAQTGVIPATTQGTAQRCSAFKSLFNLGNGVNISNGVPIYCSGTSAVLKVISFGLMIAGIIAILFLMVGGFFYLTSAGNEEQSEKGKKILINSIIGLAVIIMSTAIVTIVSGLLAGH